MARPDLAEPAVGAREALAGLVGRYAIVAVVSGRRSDEVAALVGVEGVRYEGVYGVEGETTAIGSSVLGRVVSTIASEPAVWAEDKGVSVAVHYRETPDPEAARERLRLGLEAIAAEAGLQLLEGKMVWELVPVGRPLKGGAVERLAADHELDALLYAGDDLVDIGAFEAMDRLAAQGILTVKIAVRGDETPDALLAAADLTVEGPADLIDLLRSL